MKRTQINPEINDLFRIHQFSFFLVDKWAKNFTFCMRRCYAMPVCLTSISCGMRSLEEEIHIESDYTVKQTIREEFAVRAQQSPIQMKNSRSPSSQENFIHHVTFWPTVRSMKAVLSLGRNTCLLLYIWYSGMENITIVQNKFHRNSLLDLNFFNSMEFTIIGIFNFEWAFLPKRNDKISHTEAISEKENINSSRIH